MGVTFRDATVSDVAKLGTKTKKKRGRPGTDWSRAGARIAKGRAIVVDLTDVWNPNWDTARNLHTARSVMRYYLPSGKRLKTRHIKGTKQIVMMPVAKK